MSQNRYCLLQRGKTHRSRAVEKSQASLLGVPQRDFRHWSQGQENCPLAGSRSAECKPPSGLVHEFHAFRREFSDKVWQSLGNAGGWPDTTARLLDELVNHVAMPLLRVPHGV
ncbi:MAG: hypothetical protein O7D29_00490 [Gemmatimonadetes bacterium]|nr:hypothetical protein [Gemmatimonadota bacterium]